jgi:hypothetical protein
MSRSLPVTVDPATVSMAKTLEATARTNALVVVTGRAYLDLVRELGSDRAVVRRLLRIVERVGKPIGVNVPTDYGSRTAFIAPRSWSRDRLAGWVADRHRELEDMLGPATPVPLEDA